MKIIDPLKIKEKDLPMIMLTDNLRSFISWGIRHHTKGNYSHIGFIIHPKMFASQLLTFKEVPIENYMKPYYRLKFFIVNLDKKKREEIIKTVEELLNQPFYKKTYDFLGILGQFLNIRFINDPFHHYCSEIVADVLRKYIILPLKPSPSDLNRIMSKNDNFRYYGHWVSD